MLSPVGAEVAHAAPGRGSGIGQRLDLRELWADLTEEAHGDAPAGGTGENGWTGRRWSGRRRPGRRWSGSDWSGGNGS